MVLEKCELVSLVLSNPISVDSYRVWLFLFYAEFKVYPQSSQGFTQRALGFLIAQSRKVF